MIETWYALAALAVTIYVVMDGFDLGAGAVAPIVARGDAERRQVLAAIGPYWDGNEVWLLATAGVLFLAFPKVLAAGLSGFYLAIMLVLWTLILRGVSIEFRGHLEDPLWRAFWDAAFVLASALLAIFLGAALGNLVRGLPIGPDGWFTLALFTDFSPRGEVGILDWYTLVVALFALAAIAAHGAAFLAWKTEGPVQRRARRAGLVLWAGVAVLWPAVTLATRAVDPGFLGAVAARPAAWLGGLAAVAGIVAALAGLRAGRDGAAFLGSCAFLAGLLAATAAALYPVMLRAAGGGATSITAADAAADDLGLRVALVWWPVAFLLAVAYFAVVFRLHRGKVAAAPEGEGS